MSEPGNLWDATKQPTDLVPIGFHLESPDGEITPWKDCQHQQRRANLSFFLIVDTLSFDCDVALSLNHLIKIKQCPSSNISLSESLECTIQFKLRTPPHLREINIHLDIEDKPTQVPTRWELLVLNLQGNHPKLCALIVKHVSNHYERVGIVQIRFENSAYMCIQGGSGADIDDLIFKRKTFRLG